MDPEADPQSVADGPEAPAYDADRFDIYFGRLGVGGGALYLAVLLIVAGALAALPLVRVPVSIRAQGYLRARAETQVIHAPVSGTVIRMGPGVGAQVAAGDTLVVLDRRELRSRRNALLGRGAVLELERADLRRLVGVAGAAEPNGDSLSSVRYRQEWRAFSAEAEQHAVRFEAASRESARTALLLQRTLIAAADADAARDRVDEARLQSAMHRHRALSRWRSELASIEEVIRQQVADLVTLDEEIGRLAVIAPVKGVVDELAAIAAGTELRAGERIATVTPASELVAELYVGAAELDAVAPGGEVRLQLQSRLYSDGGLRRGRIVEISPDLTRLGDRPFGRVVVRLAAGGAPDRGTAVKLRRGMAVSAWMRGTPRTLWALLRNRGGMEAPPARRPISAGVSGET